MNPTVNPARIEQYVTNHGTFFKVNTATFGFSYSNVLVNGFKVSDLIKYDGYSKVDGLIERVQALKPGTTIQVGWTLHSPDIASDAIPLNLTMAQLTKEWDDDEESFGGEFGKLHTLYKPLYESSEPELIDVPFELLTKGNLVIINLEKPEEMQIAMHSDSCFTRQALQQVNLSSVVCYDDIVRILTPEFMLHSQPCMLTSHQVYRIVRAHIKANINPRVARITSDYDFCFTVKKIVKTEPFVKRIEKLTRNGNSYKPRQYTQKTETEVLVDGLFAITYAGYKKPNEGYEGYECIPEWKANSLVEMQKHIKDYLDALMYVINLDIKQCECCNGVGYSVLSTSTVKRKGE